MMVKDGAKQAALVVRTPIRVALEHGRAHHGTIVCQLTDEAVQRVPSVLRSELSYWVEQHANEPNPRPLDLDTPDVTIDNIVAALEREVSARHEREVEGWMQRYPKGWFEYDGRPTPPIQSLMGDVRIAESVENHQEWARAERAAYVGLAKYAIAERIPGLLRAATEGYDVRRPALDYYATLIARFDEDAIVLTEETPEFEHARFDERRAPSEHAFDVLDRLKAYLKQLRQPQGVLTLPDRISRYRPAVLKDHRGAKQWGPGEPITVIYVTLQAMRFPLRKVVFVAEEEDRQRIKMCRRVPDSHSGTDGRFVVEKSDECSPRLSEASHGYTRSPGDEHAPAKGR